MRRRIVGSEVRLVGVDEVSRIRGWKMRWC